MPVPEQQTAAGGNSGHQANWLYLIIANLK